MYYAAPPLTHSSLPRIRTLRVLKRGVGETLIAGSSLLSLLVGPGPARPCPGGNSRLVHGEFRVRNSPLMKRKLILTLPIAPDRSGVAAQVGGFYAAFTENFVYKIRHQ